jgi:hypothetical protein
MMLDKNLHWVLSYYRNSEIGGALFFGELAQRLRPSAIQRDMTRQFADEAAHARYWTDCLETLGCEPLKLDATYQDQYLAAAGLPANLMEVLAITQVFEKRVLAQYALHCRSEGTPPAVRDTLKRIMTDEHWHIEWIGSALQGMAKEYGGEEVRSALRRYTAADREVYRRVTGEHAERLGEIRLARR